MAAVVLVHAATAARAQRCAGEPPAFVPLAPGLWLVPGAVADADATNRGAVANLLLARSGEQLWMIGSGPSPVFARRLACHAGALAGVPVSDVVSPWPQPESVLGVAGLPGVRHWAHADVAAAMRERCAHCEERLRARLGDAAGDLGEGVAAIPGRVFDGDSGRLGPWRWWRLSRGPGQPVTVWQFADEPVRFAPGLLWGRAAPDGRDGEGPATTASLSALVRLAERDAAGARWLGSQGGVLEATAPQAHLRYWQRLEAAVREAVDAGDIDNGQPPPIPGLEAAAADPLHALNWQRTFRQVETLLLQRSLR